jgi:hypothetical protein
MGRHGIATDAAPRSRAGMARLAGLITLFAVLGALLALPSAAPAAVKTFKAAKVKGGIATFRPKGVVAAQIRSARVVSSQGTKQVSLSLVRQGVRSGYLRVRIAGSRSRSHSRRAQHKVRLRRAHDARRKGKRTTLVIVTNDPPPSPPPTGGASTSVVTRDDAAAASLVTPRPENRPDNYAANHYMPTSSELSAFHNAVFGPGTPNAGHRADENNPLLKRVSGGFTGTTDEILQWAAYKWGFSPDVLRAVAIVESNWNQQAMGDRRDGVDASKYPAQSRIDSDSVYESLGITQVKWRADGSLNPGSEPLRWKSTAFNADLWGAIVRYYYDGLCKWCGSGYSAGQLWESIGAHFSPSPWRNAGQMNYIDKVKGVMAAQPWPH